MKTTNTAINTMRNVLAFIDKGINVEDFDLETGDIKVNVAVANVVPEWQKWVHSDQIRAIKELRQETGMGLADAKNHVVDFCHANGIQTNLYKS